MELNQKNYFKYAVGFLVCLAFRFIPFRAPNIETILATQMPFSRIYGKILAFSFGFFSIIVYDLLTLNVGVWTILTSLSYGLLGLWASIYFEGKDNNSFTYVKFALMSTILFDMVTGLTLGPLFFNQSFSGALMGQIPFTMLHLLGNISFAYILSPAIYNLLLEKEKIREKYFINNLNHKTI